MTNKKKSNNKAKKALKKQRSEAKHEKKKFTSPLTSFSEEKNKNNKNKKKNSIPKKHDKKGQDNDEKTHIRRRRKLRERLEAEEERALTESIFGEIVQYNDEDEDSNNDDDDDSDNEDIAAAAAEIQDNKEEEEEEAEAEAEADVGLEKRIEERRAAAEGSVLFEIDREGASAPNDDNGNGEEEEENNNNNNNNNNNSDEDEDEEDEEDEDEDEDEDEEMSEEEEGPSPAWVDEDDAQLVTSILSSNRLRKLRKHRREVGVDHLPGTEYERRLRHRFIQSSSAGARTDWARLPQHSSATSNPPTTNNSDDDDEDENAMTTAPTASKLLSSSASLIMDNNTTKSSTLPSHILQIMRHPDANLSDPSKTALSSVQFHTPPDQTSSSHPPLLLTAGFDKTLRFFRIHKNDDSYHNNNDDDGNDDISSSKFLSSSVTTSSSMIRSEKVCGMHFKNFPICAASFLGHSPNVAVCARRPFFYIYDAVAGKVDKILGKSSRKECMLEQFATSSSHNNNDRYMAFATDDGYISMIDVRTKLWLMDFKLNGSVNALTFSHDGQSILASGSDADVYRWDIRNNRCVDRFYNEDGTTTTSLSTSFQHLAIGSESGVVNLYDNNNNNNQNNSSFFSTQQQHHRKQPIKSIYNLQTSIHQTIFNHDGQLLAMSSSQEKDALKILHVPSRTIFSNWPTTKTPLSYVKCMDFSSWNSEYMILGNDRGQCLLYQLKHYTS